MKTNTFNKLRIMSFEYAIIVVKNCNIVHDNYNVSYYAILLCIIDVCRHNIILFYKWNPMYPGWFL